MNDLEVFLAEPPKPEDLITTVPEVLLEKDLGEILTALEFKRELVSIFSQMVIEPPVMITIVEVNQLSHMKLLHMMILELVLLWAMVLKDMRCGNIQI